MREHKVLRQATLKTRRHGVVTVTLTQRPRDYYLIEARCEGGIIAVSETRGSRQARQSFDLFKSGTYGYGEGRILRDERTTTGKGAIIVTPLPPLRPRKAA